MCVYLSHYILYIYIYICISLSLSLYIYRYIQHTTYMHPNYCPLPILDISTPQPVPPLLFLD